MGTRGTPVVVPAGKYRDSRAGEAVDDVNVPVATIDDHNLESFVLCRLSSSSAMSSISKKMCFWHFIGI